MSFSVLMSVYQKENPEYLKEALQSVFFQTLPPQEVILVKDGPLTEGLEGIIRTYEKNYPQLVVCPLDENVGLGRALQQGIAHCSYDLVARMDTDDIAVASRFEKQYQYMCEHPEIAVTGGLMEEFDDEGNIRQMKHMPEDQQEILKYARLRNPLNHMTVMFRKADVLQAGGYRHFPYLEDYDLWSRMLAGGAQFYNIQEVLVKARISEQLYERRGGYGYCRNYLQLRRQQRNQGLLTLGQYVKACIVTMGITLISGSFRQKIYGKYLRNRS